MLRDEGPIPMKCQKFNTDPTVNAVCFELPGRHDEQMDWRNSAKRTYKFSETDSCHALKLPE